MSHYDELIRKIKVASVDFGIPELARRAGMSDDTLRRILKNPPKAIQNLKALEDIADGNTATGAEEPGGDS